MRTALLLSTLLTLSACSLERRAVRIGTPEANELVEAYRHTTWNRDNNRPGEERTARRELRRYVREYNKLN